MIVSIHPCSVIVLVVRTSSLSKPCLGGSLGLHDHLPVQPESPGGDGWLGLTIKLLFSFKLVLRP